MTDALTASVTTVDLVAALALVALALYAVTGGADFGGGVWDRLATGPRKAAQRHLIEKALAPIWETNHVWLIFVVVVLFSGFPAGFAAVGVALALPLSLALVGIVLRGAAFVFRQYGGGTGVGARRWGRVFGAASLVAPFFLGTSLAALTGGQIRVDGDGVVTTTVAAWWGVYPIGVGLFVVALFAYLAAVYLCVEATTTTDAAVDVSALTGDFRRRALVTGVVAGALSIGVRLAAARQGGPFAQALLTSRWSSIAVVGVAVLAGGALAALWLRRFRLARGLAVVQVLAVVAAFGVAQHPYLIAPDVRLADVAAPAATLSGLLIVMTAGSVVLLPALIWLFRVFKTRERKPPARTQV